MVFLQPFAVGAIAQKRGVTVLQPIVLASLVMILVLWTSLPGGFRKRGLEDSLDRGTACRANGARGWIKDIIGKLKKPLGHRSQAA